MLDGDYADIVVRIRPWDKARNHYPVEATLDDGSVFVDGRLQLDQQALLLAQLDPRAYGVLLFDALFHGPIGDAYNQAKGHARERTRGRLRVHLWIDDAAPELHALPWERLYHILGDQLVPLATSSLTPLSRFTGLPRRDPAPSTAWPIRILFAVANPTDLESRLNLTPVDVEDQVRTLHQALGDLRQGRFEVTILPGRKGLPPDLCKQLKDEGYQIHEGATTLNRILRFQRNCHVFHFLGHGAFLRDEGTAFLYLEWGDGKARRVRDATLVPKLAALDPQPQLVFLAACESAKRDREAPHPFVGLAPKLVKAGVPAVVAMQDKVPVSVAKQLTGDFYRDLVDHGIVDLALNQARNLLFEGEETDWTIPVLFMRLKDGRLWAPHPVRRALEAIRSDEKYAFYSKDKGQYLALPIEVVCLTGSQDFRAFEPLATEATATIDIWRAVRDIWLQPPKGSKAHEARLVVLVGGYGSNKSTQLQRMVWETTEAAISSRGTDPVLPVLVDLEKFSTARSSLRNAIEELILDSLRPYWPDLTAPRLAELLKEGTTLRVLLDNIEYLTEQQRKQACGQLQGFIQEHPQHQYLLCTSSTSFDPEHLQDLDLQILVIQHLERRKIRRFLQGLRDDGGGIPLLEHLDRTGLFDMAAVPGFMVKMVLRARAGRYPDSRTEILQDMLEDAIAKIPPKQGMQAHAEEVLETLAWQMQTTLSTTLPLSQAFAVMRRVRGTREYSLEEFYETLIDSGLLARVGAESLRFAYRRFQSYCCAKAAVGKKDRARILDDITASLGRLTRLRWWHEALTFACGLLAQDIRDVAEAETLEQFLRVVIYGVNLLESEEAFLAARCLMESEQAMQGKYPPIGGREPEKAEERLQDMKTQVVTALTWRLSNLNEPRSSHRSQAALLLGHLAQEDAIEDLARTAYGKPRSDLQGRNDFDYCNVRMAATVGILRLTEDASDQILNRIDPVLVKILKSWRQGDKKDVNNLVQLLEHTADKKDVDDLVQWLAPTGDKKDVDDLVQWLEQRKNVAAQGIAALALGDLRMRLALDTDRKVDADKALHALTMAFLRSYLKGEDATLWAVSYALAMIDLATVKEALADGLLQKEQELLGYEIDRVGDREAALDRFFTGETELFDDEENLLLHCKCLSHLIGLLRWQEKRTYDFLVERCLKHSGKDRLATLEVGELIKLGSVAIGAMERLADKEHEPLLKEIASGNFEQILKLGSAEDDRAYLQRKAIDALATIGGPDTAMELRKGLRSQRKGPDRWSPALERALYRTSQEIFWRLNWNVHL